MKNGLEVFSIDARAQFSFSEMAISWICVLFSFLLCAADSHNLFMIWNSSAFPFPIFWVYHFEIYLLRDQHSLNHLNCFGDSIFRFSSSSRWRMNPREWWILFKTKLIIHTIEQIFISPRRGTPSRVPMSDAYNIIITFRYDKLLSRRSRLYRRHVACDHLNHTLYAHGTHTQTRISHCVANGDLRRFTYKCAANGIQFSVVVFFCSSRDVRDVVAVRPPSLASTVPLFSMRGDDDFMHGTTRVTPTTVRLEDWMQCERCTLADRRSWNLCKTGDRLVAQRMIIFLLRPSYARLASQMAVRRLRLRCTHVRNGFVHCNRGGNGDDSPPMRELRASIGRVRQTAARIHTIPIIRTAFSVFDLRYFI